MNDLIAFAQAWMAVDPDPITRAATAAMLDDPILLREHFSSWLQFGTAGMRGEMGPGCRRMNRVLVRQVSAGLADYVLAAGGDSVVIGFDGRLGSRRFAADTAAVCASRGLRVVAYADVVPTPELAHAVTMLGVSAGIMVTASHNPPADNGYKVYWSNGAQIVSPHDTGIASAIAAVPLGVDAPDVEPEAVPPEVRETYLAAVDANRVHRVHSGRFVYTAMHGVGAELVGITLGRAGHDVVMVPEQTEPDGRFPTVAFPNPEEPGALDLAYALATHVGAAAVLANDPDADRLAVAIPVGDGWRQLTGNEVGWLMADDLLEHGAGEDRMVATSIVSSMMLDRIAAHHGASCVRTLTGFKWIATAAIAHRGTFVMGYEEAIGYSVGTVVRDKDGVSAALVVADLVCHLAARGETLGDALDKLAARHGLHLARQRSLRFAGLDGQAEMAAFTEALRESPPASIAGIAVARVTDVSRGTIVDAEGTRACPLPSSDVQVFELADGSRVIVRPSGTEPKLKFYFEVVVDVGQRSQGMLTLDALEAAVVPAI
jgi:phosphomannomutase